MPSSVDVVPALVDSSGLIALPPNQVIRRLGTDGVWRRFAPSGGAVWVTHGRGASARRQRLIPGDIVRLGRRVALVVSMHHSERYPDVAEWRGFLVRSLVTWRVLLRLAAAAMSGAPVWLRGPSGAGKELAARALHAVSGRAGGPFVALNCAALPDGLAEAELFGAIRGAYTGAVRDRPGAFEAADGGTLFLDEVGELPLSTQAKLLRVLEEGVVQPLGMCATRRVDVRVVAATWRDIAATPESFRFDLLQRIGVLEVELPALRERPEDIGSLLEARLQELDAADLFPDAPLMAALERFEWPGNVRQLRSAAQRAAVWGDPRELMPASRAPVVPRRDDRPGFDAAVGALRSVGGNRSAAARSLGVSRSTLYRWLALPSQGAQRVAAPVVG